jgi:hypothetical protein
MFPALEFGLHYGAFKPTPGAVLRLWGQGENLVDPITPKNEPSDQHPRRTEVRGQQDDPPPSGKHMIQMASALDGGHQTLNERLIQALVEETVDDMLITSHQVAPHQAPDRRFGQLLLKDGLKAPLDLAIQLISHQQSMEST